MVDVEIEYSYSAEYAKSNRAACKSCKDNIAKDALRLAIMVQSPAFDGKIPNWYHYNCFFKKAHPKSVREIKNFDSLRWEDQEKIKKSLEGKGTSSSKKEEGELNLTEKFYSIEYAKSNRSSCRGCDAKIAQNEIRISKKDFETVNAKRYGNADRWYHLECFINDKDSLVEDVDDFIVDKIPGINKLSSEDKEIVLKKLKFSSKKRKAEKSGDTEVQEPVKKKSKEEQDAEDQLKKQSQDLWKMRDNLSKSLTKADWTELLTSNSQVIPTGEAAILDRLSDILLFGALDKCPECKNGQLVYSNYTYACTGMATEWTKCLYKIKSPCRHKVIIPASLKEVPFLKSYKYKVRERLFPPEEEVPIVSKKVETKSKESLPLGNMKIVITKGPFPSGKSKKQLETMIRELGGKVITKVSEDTAVVISSQKLVDNVSKEPLISSAQKHNVHVVSEDFVDNVGKGGAVLLIQTHSIASWGGNPLDRISAATSKSQPKKEAFKKELGTVKMTVKGGAAVDPDSELADVAHILQDPSALPAKEPLNAVLGMVDLVKGSNSFYKLQALEADAGKKCWVFRSWGRIGTDIGGNKLEQFSSAGDAAEHFKNLYYEKTGNHWHERKNSKKVPNKFYPLELDYGGDDDDLPNLDLSTSTSKLPSQVQDLIRFIFDIESMKSAMLEFEIDLKKMPLGKLSKNQIEKAYKVLTELNDLIESGNVNQSQLLDGSTRFYTLIPHDFGMRRPPMLDSIEIIKSKTEMLDNLLEIEVAYNMIKGAAGDSPIDSHYDKLNSDIKPVDKNSAEYKRIVQYVKNTHASTHKYYDLEVTEIFTIERKDEAKRYEPNKTLHNRKLLWHGSRRTNWAGIISQGLRIAPPEAPVTGYMFGKGVYFADMVSKSANYCFTNATNPAGLLLLCEVALGNMAERFSSDTHIKLKSGEHSCKGVGQTCPNPKEDFMSEDGVVYPMGKGMSAGVSSSLLYNEYIVYDVAQVQQKYLIRMNFNYS